MGEIKLLKDGRDGRGTAREGKEVNVKAKCKSVLVVTIEMPGNSRAGITERIELTGEESEADIREIAEETFWNLVNYGYYVEESP